MFQGDSGGPVVCQKSLYGPFFLASLVCGSVGSTRYHSIDKVPCSLYTPMDLYITWVNETIDKELKKSKSDK